MASEINVTNDLIEVADMDELSTDVCDNGHNLADIVIGVGIGLAIPVAIKTVKKGVAWIKGKISHKSDEFIDDYDEFEEEDDYDEEIRKAE